MIWGDFRGEKWNARGGGGDDWIMEGSVRMMCIFMEDASWDCPKDGVASLASSHNSINHTHFTRSVHLCAWENIPRAGSPKRHVTSRLAEITKKKDLNVAFDSSDWAIVFS